MNRNVAAKEEIGEQLEEPMILATGSAYAIMYVIKQVLPKHENRMLRERALSIISALVTVKVDIRDMHGTPLSFNCFKKELTAVSFIELLKKEQGRVLCSSNKAIENDLKNLPGWRKGMPLAKQNELVLFQFSYARYFWCDYVEQNLLDYIKTHPG